MANKYPLTVAGGRVALTLLFLSLLFVARHALASDTQHMLPLSLQERVAQADVVVEGEVVRQKSFWDARHENIYTSNIIKVYKSFKGEVQAGEVEVITEGGTVGLKKHVYSTALMLKPGQQGMFFLKRQQVLQRTPGSTPLSTSAYGSQQGFVAYNMADRTARGVFDSYGSVQKLYEEVRAKTGQSYRTVTENEKLQAAPIQQRQQQGQAAPLAPAISSFAPKVASAGTGVVLTINGSGFGSSRGNGAVEFQNADDGGQTYVRPLPDAYISWTNTRIQMYIPSITVDQNTVGSGPIRVVTDNGGSAISQDPIILEFAYSNVDYDDKSFQPILVGPDGGGYDIHFAPSMQSRQAAQEGFRRAMNTWVCASEVNWEIGSPTSKEVAADDGVVVIRFAPTSVVGANVLARTVSRYEGCPSETDTLFWVSEFDMEINNSINWEYGPAAPVRPQFDFETVMLHELGHAHQLGHVNLVRAVMFYAIESEQLVRDLSSLDIAGAELVLANSVLLGATLGEYNCRNVPGPMIPNPEGECNLAPEILALEAEFTSPDAVAVSWTTRNELVVNNFLIQRSPNGIDFTDIGTTDADGPRPDGDLNYTFVEDRKSVV